MNLLSQRISALFLLIDISKLSSKTVVIFSFSSEKESIAFIIKGNSKLLLKLK